MLKVLSNGCFLPILLDEKKRGDGHLFNGNKGAKVVETSSKNDLLINLLDWPSLYLSRTRIGICGKNHVRKGNEGNLGQSISKADGSRGAENLGTAMNTIDIDREINNPNTATNIAKKRKT